MSKQDKGAFPCGFKDVSTYQYVQAGLTKRELFAAMAMHGFCSNGGASWFAERGKDKWFAQASVQAADALILELEKVKHD